MREEGRRRTTTAVLLLLLFGAALLAGVLLLGVPSAPPRGTPHHRRLLQQAGGANPFVLAPLVPINWWFFRDAPLVDFNIDDPVFNYWLTFSSNLVSLNAMSFGLFGDLPLVSLGIPQFDIFGGRGYNALTEEGIEGSAILVELAAWIEAQFFDLGADIHLARLNLWETFGFEDLGLGLPENFADHWSVPWSIDGAVEVNVFEGSFVNWVRSGGLLALLDTISSPFNGVNVSSI